MTDTLLFIAIGDERLHLIRNAEICIKFSNKNLKWNFKWNINQWTATYRWQLLIGFVTILSTIKLVSIASTTVTNVVSRRTRNTLHRCSSRPCLWHNSVLLSGLFWFLSLVSSPPICSLLFFLLRLSPLSLCMYDRAPKGPLYLKRGEGVGGSYPVLLSRPANGSSAVRVEPELAVWASNGANSGTFKPKKIIPPKKTVGGKRNLMQSPPPQTIATKQGSIIVAV